MRIRDLALVGVRLIAVWFALHAVFEITVGFYVVFSLIMTEFPVFPGSTVPAYGYALGQVLTMTLRLAAACLLFVFAPRLADWVCRGVADDLEAPGLDRLVAGSLYHIACFVMGLWLLARSIAPGVKVLAELVEYGDFRSSQGVVEFCQSGLFLIFGAALIFGSRGLSRMLASLGHDADNVPAQQFTLKLILGLMFVGALLLATLRTLLFR